MNLMNRLTIKNLKMNKKRTIVTIIGIILSVALITSLCSLYQSLLGSLINFEVSEKGNYHILIYQVEQDDINKYKNNINIDKIYYSKDIGYAKIETKNEYKPYIFIKGITESSLKNFPITLKEGKMPTNDNEVLISSHLKTNGRVTYNVGDTITLNVGKRVSDGYELNQNDSYKKEDNQVNEKIINTTTKEYKIVGIIERPPREIEPYNAPGYTFFTIINEQEMNDTLDVYIRYKKNVLNDFEKITYNLFDVNYDDINYCQNNTNENNEKCEEINSKIKYGLTANEYLIQLETDPIGIKTTSSIAVVVCIVCGIIIFTSVFCIKNSFDISITEKIKQYGMLKSIGATKKQIRKNVLYEATVLGLIGIPLGLLSGFFATYILTLVSNFYLKDMVSFNICFTFSWISVIVSIILGIITIYLSAYRSAHKASKVSPIDSIRNSSEIKLNSKKIKAPKFINKLFGIGGEMSYKNLKRNKKKYRTTIISIITSVLVFISLTSFMNMTLDSVKNDYKNYEYNIYMSMEDNELDNKTLNTIITNETIEKYSISSHSGIEVKKDNLNKEYVSTKFKNQDNLDDMVFYINIQSINNDIYKEYVKELGLNYEEVKNKGILFDIEKVYYEETKNEKSIEKTKYMRKYNYEKNNYVKGYEFGEPTKPTSIQVGYVADKQPWGFYNNTSATLYITEETFNKIFEVDNTTIYFESSNPSKLQDEIEKTIGDYGYNLYNIEEDAKMMRNFFTLIGIFFYGFIIVITLIGVTNIFNTITTNIELRKQEFAMLRSIGMTKKEFNNMIRLESIFMGTKALFFGITIGLILSYLIYYFLKDNYGIPYTLPLNAIIISIVAVFLLITLIMNYSVNKIKKQNIIETIRNENI